MKEQYKGKLVNGDSEINKNHHENETSMKIDVDKKDVAQIYVVQVKEQLKAQLKIATDKKNALKTKSVQLVGTIDSLINSTVEKAYKQKVEKVTQTYKDLKAEIKALVKKAATKVDKSIATLFSDTEEIDTRIKTTVKTPDITYSWRPLKVVKDDGSGEEVILRITLKIDEHSETNDLPIPKNIEALKSEHLAVESDIHLLDSEIDEIQDTLRSSKDLQEKAEAAVAMAKVNQSEFGRECLTNLNNLMTNGRLLLGAPKED